MDAVNCGASEGVSRGKVDGDSHQLFVDGDGGGNLPGGGRDFDVEGSVGGRLRWAPGADDG